MYTFIALLIIYVAALIAVGWHFAKKQRTMTDFWIAGREIGAGNIGMSAAASWLTAGALFLVTGMFLFIGTGSIWIFVAPNIIALAAIALLVPRIKRLPSLTQPELIELRYGPLLRAPIAIAIMIVMILFAVTDFKGFGYVLSVFYGIPQIYAVLIMVVAISLYVTLGGLRAVIWTDSIQFVFLAALALLIGAAALYIPVQTTGMAVSDLFAGMGAGFWDIFALGGIVGVFIMMIAMLPGWVTEQDPWQRVWAARDVKSAQYGMMLGSVLIAAVFFACFLAAIGLNALYPAPTDMPAAEQIYLTFIGDTFSPVAIALIAIGFAAAAMSCADTFATSGASCVSRDIYQRFIKPDATMKEMRTMNRALIVVMLIISAAISMRVETILDAVIMATVIGTSSYFFPIMGALFWKRATAKGAFAGLVIGGTTQIGLIIAEATYIEKLDAISPFLIEHGVIIAVSLSAISFITVSLATKRSDDHNLAPFFPDVAERFIRKGAASVDLGDPEYARFKRDVEKHVSGERVHLSAVVKTKKAFGWGELVSKLADTRAWIAPSGVAVAYRMSNTDMLACPRIVHGGEGQVWIFAEPPADKEDDVLLEMFAARHEIRGALA
ncbi:MAG: sodium:solute symporter family protein [Euryarchaeota archaeon]|nr:sodium:solute symporter family protein [Euryarchaeota archaeon]